MKKTLISAIFTSILLTFTGCAGMMVDTSKKAEYQASVGTPEDSVVFYGFLSMDSFHSFSQMNPDFPPDYQEISNQAVVSKPVAPGSQYVLEYNAGSYRAGNVQYYWGSYYPLQTPLSPITVNIPKKPGLYYMGIYDGRSVAWGNKGKDEKLTDGNESFCLECALKLYEGTSWEKVILERMEELKNKKAEEKNAK